MPTRDQLILAAPKPRIGVPSRRRDPMVHEFTPTPAGAGMGVANVAYTTFAAQVYDLVGAGTGYGNAPIKPFTKPMVVQNRLPLVGTGILAGQFVSTPLSK